MTPQFNHMVESLIQFLRSHNIELYSIADLMNSSHPNDNFIKIYVNYPHAGIVVHRPFCPDKPNLISGYGDATDNGFWVGMFKKEEILEKFSDLQNFVNQISSLFGYNNNGVCDRCKP